LNPYIANTQTDVRAMLDAIGVKSVDALFVDIKPEHAPKSFDLPQGLSEFEVMERLRLLAAKNTVLLFLLSAGVITTIMSLPHVRRSFLAANSTLLIRLISRNVPRVRSRHSLNIRAVSVP
jgi:glycine cleavage system pyridoxal-binding protein P